ARRAGGNKSRTEISQSKESDADLERPRAHAAVAAGDGQARAQDRGICHPRHRRCPRQADREALARKKGKIRQHAESRIRSRVTPASAWGLAGIFKPSNCRYVGERTRRPARPFVSSSRSDNAKDLLFLAERSRSFKI